MDFDDPRQRQVFFAVHDGLPREGPGDRDSLERALALAGLDSSDRPLRVLDLGCGPGLQTIALAELLPTAEIEAVDLHQPFLDELDRRAAAAGVAKRIKTVCGDMAKLEPAIQGAFDLIWCEGAAYIVGFERAIAAWRPLLAPGGRMALTEALWLRPEVPHSVRRCWDEYPDMTDVEGCRTRIRAAGMELLGDFVLPESAWWHDYYEPMQARLEEVRAGFVGDAVAEAVLREHDEEIAMYRDHSDCYGYSFFVMKARV